MDSRKMVEGVRSKMEVQDAMETIDATWEALLISFAGTSKMKKANFDALIKEGFTEYQALVLTDLQFKQASEGGKSNGT